MVDAECERRELGVECGVPDGDGERAGACYVRWDAYELHGGVLCALLFPERLGTSRPADMGYGHVFDDSIYSLGIAYTMEFVRDGYVEMRDERAAHCIVWFCW